MLQRYNAGRNLPNMRRCMLVMGLKEPHPSNTTCLLELIANCRTQQHVTWVTHQLKRNVRAT